MTGALRQQVLDLRENRLECGVLCELALATAHACPHALVAESPLPLPPAAPDAPLAGAPVAIKDLFDAAGQPTRAGSAVLADAPPASRDATLVARLRAAGAGFIGRANMSEFAFSGLGVNPHYGTPACVWQAQGARLPGGSSSGCAVLVASGAITAALGSDTAGSCRIPAAFNGITGVKPSFGRLPLDGVLALSPSSDAAGPLAADVDSCFLLDQALCGRLQAGRALPRIAPMAARDIRLAVPVATVMEGLDDEVSHAFAQACTALRAAGMDLAEVPMPVLDEALDLFLHHPVAAYEAWQFHKAWLAQSPDLYDPLVRSRISAGEKVSAAEQQRRYVKKAAVRAGFEQALAAQRAQAVFYPTCALIPPPFEAGSWPLERQGPLNLRCLRNTAVMNYVDGCAASLPCQRPPNAPVGCMLGAAHGQDDQLYQIAATVEAALAPLLGTAKSG